jgi:2,4-dienoyl-CoA reductase-like NADH-dependent reductase (Old Yellow Enzyme family)
LENKIWQSPIRIGKKYVKNRIVFPPISGNWAEENGNPSEKTLKFYKELAAGGCGMIVVEGTSVCLEGKTATNCLVLHR